jgi:hypothetical protein
MNHRCEHCRHTQDEVPSNGGCLGSLFLVAVLLVTLFVALNAYRWTSIEGDCVVERRWSMNFDDSDDRTVVVDRLCP